MTSRGVVMTSRAIVMTSRGVVGLQNQYRGFILKLNIF